MNANPETQREVLAVLEAYSDTLAARDMAGMLALFADDADVVLFGSGADERRVGKEALRVQAERDWSQSEAMALKYQWSSVSAAGSVAWASTELTVSARINGDSVELPARFSVVLQRRGENWLIVQGHFSIPARDQADGHSWPMPG